MINFVLGTLATSMETTDVNDTLWTCFDSLKLITSWHSRVHSAHPSHPVTFEWRAAIQVWSYMILKAISNVKAGMRLLLIIRTKWEKLGCINLNEEENFRGIPQCVWGKTETGRKKRWRKASVPFRSTAETVNGCSACHHPICLSSCAHRHVSTRGWSTVRNLTWKWLTRNC